ncbi:MAG: transcriptional regulator [Dehalococcoidia bacterium]|nr:transcriptional regulator [Dehalococcoidia bacterium]
MATTEDFIQYVCEQIEGAGTIRYKKMFGEYLVYVDERPTLLVCDNTVYVKNKSFLDGILENPEKGFPYDGAKEHLVLDIEDSEKAKTVAAVIVQNTPMPKRK